MENIPEWVFVLLGAMRFGAVTVPFPTTLPEPHLVRIAQHAGCRVLFTDKENHAKAAQVVAEVNAELVDIEEPRRQAPDSKAAIQKTIDGEATVLLIYTSGTTGDPKGVQLSMLNLIYEIRGIVEPLEISADYRILSVTSVFPCAAARCEWPRSPVPRSGRGVSVVDFTAAHCRSVPPASHFVFRLCPAVFLRASQTHLLAGRGTTLVRAEIVQRHATCFKVCRPENSAGSFLPGFTRPSVQTCECWPAVAHDLIRRSRPISQNLVTQWRTRTVSPRPPRR